MPPKDDLPVLGFASAAEFERWLDTTDAPGIWLKIARAGSGIPTVTYREAVDVALCFGWIDSQKAKFDESHFLQRFTPRRRTSRWSQVNCRRATELIESGAMRPAGLVEVERAKADGRWDAAYAPPSTIEVPPDLLAALAADPVAERFFATLNSRNRFAVLHRVGTAKRPETRAARIAKFVEMLHDERTIYP